MPLARHDNLVDGQSVDMFVSTHMPLARHDVFFLGCPFTLAVSTHMPLARHDESISAMTKNLFGFYSHASCEA